MSEVRTVKSFIWSLLEQGAPKLFSIIVQIILARLLAPEIFGQLAIILVFIELMNVIAQGGLGMALIQADNVTERSYTTTFWLSLIVATFLYCLMYFCAPIISNFYSMDELNEYIRIMSLVVFMSAFNSIQRSYLQKNMKFKSLFKINLMATVFAGVLAIILAFMGFGIWALIIQNLFQSSLCCIFMFFFVSWKPSFCFDKKIAKKLFTYGWKIMVTGILDILCNGLSELIIGKACNASDLGYYSQGRKWPLSAMGIVASGIQNVIFPMFSEIKNNMDRLRAAIEKSLSLGSYLFIPLCFLLTSIAAPLISLLLTEVWMPSVLIFQITSIQYVLAMPQIVNLRAYMALGDSKLYLKLQIMKLILTIIVVCATAIITANIYYVAFANCIVSIFNVLVIDMQPAKRQFGIGRLKQLSIIAPIIIACLVGFGASQITVFLDINSALEIIIKICLFLIGYFSCSWIIRIPGLSQSVEIIKSLRKQ